MKILRLSPADAALAALAIERIKPARTSKELVENFLERPDHYFIAAIAREQPIGFALAYELRRIDRPQSMLFLYEIGVAEAERQRGVAGAMLDFLREKCREKGFLKMFVIANVDNAAAVRLYESKFRGDGRREASVVFTFLPSS